MTDSEFEDMMLSQYSNQASEDISTLPYYIKNIMCVLLAHYPIGNGGFRFLFEINLAGNVSYVDIVEGFRAVGLTEVADQMEIVLNLFPDSVPHADMILRDEFLRTHFDSEDEDGNPNPSYSSVVENAERIYYGTFKRVPSILHQHYKSNRA